MMRDLSERSGQAELMDSPDVDYATFRACLQDLAKVNVLSLGYRPTLTFLESLRRKGRLDQDRPIEILDVGSGYGDLLRTIHRWADGHGVPVRLTGLDLNPWSARAAAGATPGNQRIRWITGDVFAHEGRADIIVSSLFTHHLDDGRVIRFLRWMEGRAGIGWFVNDLHRHALPYRTFGPLAAAFRWHRFVRHDGPVSFARAFVPEDWGRLLQAAQIPDQGTQVATWFPFRLCVSRDRMR
ncbi:methyltransferase domain-containing protein [Rubellimicrobium arenae]|uniref:methyltransferase domain-containing protein n=1 Tax=Rubellimicrobium arenae TaxID=2817372 RepID=UPI001B30ACC9|nr:methyltransferase domain-containing protein [Rubellimicrobium arenae]